MRELLFGLAAAGGIIAAVFLVMWAIVAVLAGNEEDHYDYD